MADLAVAVPLQVHEQTADQESESSHRRHLKQAVQLLHRVSGPQAAQQFLAELLPHSPRIRAFPPDVLVSSSRLFVLFTPGVCGPQ